MNFVYAFSLIILLLASRALESGHAQSDIRACQNTHCTPAAYGANKQQCWNVCTSCNDVCDGDPTTLNPGCTEACTNCAKNCGTFAKGSTHQTTCLNQCEECVRDCTRGSRASATHCNAKCSMDCPRECNNAAYAQHNNAGTCMTICTEAVEKCDDDTACMNAIEECTRGCARYPRERQTDCQGYCANNCVVQTCRVTAPEARAACMQACQECVTSATLDCEHDENACIAQCTQSVAKAFPPAPPTCAEQCTPSYACTGNASCCTTACAQCVSGCASFSDASARAPCKRTCDACVATCKGSQDCYAGCALCLHPLFYCPRFSAPNQATCVNNCASCVAGCNGNANCIGAPLSSFPGDSYGCVNCANLCSSTYFPAATQLTCQSVCNKRVLQCKNDYSCTASSNLCVFGCSLKAQNGSSISDQNSCLDGCRLA